MSDKQLLRRMVERLIIENRNLLNDTSTNEPYDVKGIANDVIDLIASREQAARLDELVKVSDQFNPKDGKPFLDQDLYKWIWENRAPELNPSLLELTNSEGKDG